MSTQERYVNLFTDFGFKKIFGEDSSKELIISFLNTVLPDKQIADINYRKTEHLGQTDLDRKVIYDLYCESETGEKFIVELQKAKQSFFKDRALYYSTFPIQEQAQKGDWNYKLQPVYLVAVLDFCFDDENSDKVKTEVKLIDPETGRVFHDKLSFVYLQMPNFQKTENELITVEDQWFFVLKNLHKLEDRPAALRERVFENLFQKAEIARFDPGEREAYHDSIKYYRDVKNSLDTAFEAGAESMSELIAEERRQKEEAQEKAETERREKDAFQAKFTSAVKALSGAGMSAEQIAETLGISAEEVRKILG